MNKENKEVTAQNSRNSMSLDGRRLAKLEAINADLLAELANQVNRWQAMLEHAERLNDTGMAYSCRNALHNARAALAKATATQ